MTVVLSHLLYPRLDDARDLCLSSERIWLDLTNVPGSMVLYEKGSPQEFARIMELFESVLDSCPERLLFGTDHPAGMGDVPTIYGHLERYVTDKALLRSITLENPERFIDLFYAEKPVGRTGERASL